MLIFRLMFTGAILVNLWWIAENYKSRRMSLLANASVAGFGAGVWVVVELFKLF